MRVTVVDDSIIVREGLRRLLEAEGHHVVGTVAHPDDVAGAVVSGRPDVVVLDIRMPPTFTDEGLRAAAREVAAEIAALPAPAEIVPALERVAGG